MKVPISGQVTGAEELANLVQVGQSDHYGGGEWTRRFQRAFCELTGHREAIFCNSGSSANLLALAALELPKGSEVITTAANFPTTANAIVQLGLFPVFVDSSPKTLNVWSWNDVWEAVSDKTGAIIMAHTLGNPVNFPFTGALPVIEDCCDALGSEIGGKMVGHHGLMSTHSFYPAHHMTTGEGGMVCTDWPRLKKVLDSFRDWGRDCWCGPGEDGTCGTRFDGSYDHKYTYSRIGWNLKASEFQAAVGLAQVAKVPGFVKKRRENWAYLRKGLSDLPLEFVERTPNSNPSWFGLAFMTDRRNDLARYLDERGIGNRPIMGGNLLRQPAYKNIKHRTIGGLPGANKIHEQGLWIGVFPGITREMCDYTIETFHAYFG